MNTKNHKAYCDLMNIGIRKSLRQDVAEENRIHVHGDAVSAVWVVFDRTKNPIVTMTGRDEAPKNLEKIFNDCYVSKDASFGVRVSVDRERLIELLKGMTSQEVVLQILKTDGILRIDGMYDEGLYHDSYTVTALLMPRIDPDGE